MIPLNLLIRLSLAVMITLFLSLVLWSPVKASSQFTKETGKKCTDCHSKIPKKGDKDLYLTELGKKFKENGNKLPAENK
ncbi:MAG: hypothetical protein U0V70_01930 [Terriglobia bacterium]